MADYSGALQSFETCSTLWTVPTFPLLAAALCAWWSRGTRDNERGASREARAGRVAILCAAISVLAALTHTLLLARLPSEERCLLNHIALSARIGTFDASISLSMDALTSLLSIVVSGAGLCVLVHSVATLRGLPGHNRRLAAISLGVGGMLIVCLASDFVFMFVGWGASGVATLLLVSENERFGARAARIGFVTARLADALLVAGICVLFWTFGGGFSEAGSYVPELKPRLVGVGRASLE